MKNTQKMLMALLVAVSLAFGQTSICLAGTESKAAVQAPVSINQASAEELTVLKGIGPKTAERIVAYRQEHGPFKTIDELVMVKGIGNAKFAKLKDQIKV